MINSVHLKIGVINAYPLDVCLDAKSVYDSIIHADLRQPAEKSLIHVLGQMREHMFTRRIRQLFWIDTRDMLADGLNKGAVSRKPLFAALNLGIWKINNDCRKNVPRKIKIRDIFRRRPKD